MKTTIIFALLYINLIFSQDLKKYQNLDTIYLKFKEGYCYQNKKQINNNNNVEYIYYFYNSVILAKAKTLLKRKAFLREHKNEIIDLTNTKNLPLYLEKFLQEKYRVYYIIDVDKFKGRKILLRETHSPYIFMDD